MNILNIYSHIEYCVSMCVGHLWSNLLSFRLSFSSALHWEKERGKIKRSERFAAMSQLLSISVGFFPQCLFYAIKSYSFFFLTKFSFEPFSYLHQTSTDLIFFSRGFCLWLLLFAILYWNQVSARLVGSRKTEGKYFSFPLPSLPIPYLSFRKASSIWRGNCWEIWG